MLSPLLKGSLSPFHLCIEHGDGKVVWGGGRVAQKQLRQSTFMHCAFRDRGITYDTMFHCEASKCSRTNLPKCVSVGSPHLWQVVFPMNVHVGQSRQLHFMLPPHLLTNLSSLLIGNTILPAIAHRVLPVSNWRWHIYAIPFLYKVNTEPSSSGF